MVLPGWYHVACAAVFGAVFASFAGVLIERLPQRRSLTGRSTCACGRVLGWSENIPVVGWLRLAGRTRCCRRTIPAWYFLLEAGTATGAGLAAGYVGDWAATALIVTVLAASTTYGLRQRVVRRDPS